MQIILNVDLTDKRCTMYRKIVSYLEEWKESKHRAESMFLIRDFNVPRRI